MKTAVSTSDDVFEKADRLAKRLKKSRSQLYCLALKEYVARHQPNEVTEAMDHVCVEVGDGITGAGNFELRASSSERREIEAACSEPGKDNTSPRIR